MKILDFDQLKDRVEKDLEFDEYNLIEENQRNTAKHHHYITLKIEEEEKFAKLEEMKNKLYDKLYDQFRWDDEHHLNRAEIDIKINGNDKWTRFMQIYNQQKRIVDYLTKVEGLFSNRYYSITNAVKLVQQERY